MRCVEKKKHLFRSNADKANTKFTQNINSNNKRKEKEIERKSKQKAQNAY